jgi:hypothetical protein
MGSIILGSCQNEEKLFQIIRAEDSGISFTNSIETNDSINGVEFEYVYNGAGVAIGDVNNDGLSDLFFAGNQVSSRLYLNMGNLTFRDVSSESNILTNQWCTGVSFVDINSDGLLDIYICVAGLGPEDSRQNIFFVNQGLDPEGIPQYRDMAGEMGLADNGYSTMAVFFDYDRDQDLDVYILTNAMESRMRNALRPRRINGEGPSTDRLYQNDGMGYFRDVSKQAGILQEGYGLGVGISDINQDGWMDVYCANDFLSNDLLWINNQDGTFKEASGKYFKHFTSNGMGMDIADYNNDGLLDIIVLDMLPMSNQRQKQMIGYRNMTRFYESLKLGYHPQYLRNTLQLNRGKFKDGQYRFSEIGYLAGIYQTDWSWSPLMADFDNDGWKDLSITNGYRKDVTNLDFIYFTIQENWMFGTAEAKKEFARSAMDNLPDVKLHNFIFRNNGDLSFSDKSAEWGLEVETFSNGTAYADLDNDGDLDILTNNIDQEVIIYENLSNKINRNHYIKIVFDPIIKDFEKIGLKSWIYHQGSTQFYEYSPYRGYKSTVGGEIISGLGHSHRVDSLIIQWPDGKTQKWYNLTSDTTLVINKNYVQAAAGYAIKDFNKLSYVLEFADLTESLDLIIKHQENSSKDLDRVPTILRNLGQSGPGIATGDINNDGLDDLYVGNDSDHPGYILIQKSESNFDIHPFSKDPSYEDLGALFLDVDQDGDKDLYVVSGGSNWSDNHPEYQDRLYLNDGEGSFTLDARATPIITSSGSCVIAADYDLDGDLDLFVGGRVVPGQYPKTPKSYLLENQSGKFVDVSNKLGKENGYIGMVSSALWTDLNHDYRPDLILVGEYMPITIMINQGDQFTKNTKEYKLENTYGWWNSINGADIDSDGDIDYVIGNYGLNSFFKPTVEQPVELYANDFDLNGTFDPITTVFIQNESYIFHPRNLMIDQIPSFGERFKTFEKFSNTPFRNSFTKEEIDNSIHKQCQMMHSVILERTEDDYFRIHNLPHQAQFSPVFGIVLHDFNDDHLPDLLLTGNSFAEETVYGYYDASLGTVLINEGSFRWKHLENNKINLVAEGDKKAMVKICIGANTGLFLSENNGYLQVLGLTTNKNSIPLKLKDNDWHGTIHYEGGSSQKVEFYYGNGYLSQNSRTLMIDEQVKSLEITTFSGETRIIDLDLIEFPFENSF